jgi:hypothetical protein
MCCMLKRYDGRVDALSPARAQSSGDGAGVWKGPLLSLLFVLHIKASSTPSRSQLPPLSAFSFFNLPSPSTAFTSTATCARV